MHHKYIYCPSKGAPTNIILKGSRMVDLERGMDGYILQVGFY